MWIEWLSDGSGMRGGREGKGKGNDRKQMEQRTRDCSCHVANN